MARKPVVSRCLTVTGFMMTCVLPKKHKSIAVYGELPRTYKTHELLVKHARRKYETDELKVGDIYGIKVLKKRGYMTEEKFNDEMSVVSVQEIK